MDDAADQAGYDPPRQVTRLPSWLAGQLAAIAAGLVGAALADEGIRRQHFIVLSALVERGAASQAALGRRLAIDRSDMHAVLGDLEARGLVARVRDEGDRRRKLVELTPLAARVQEQLEHKVEAAQEALLAPLSVAERRQLSRLLARLVAHHSGRDLA